MYGADGAKLVQDAKRAGGLQSLPMYQTDVVADVCREIRDLQRDVQIVLAQAPENFRASQDRVTAAGIFMLQLCMRRDKRCLLAYHRTRAERIQQLAWAEFEPSETEAGSDAPAPTAGWHPDEEDYFRRYADNLAELKGEWTDIDLLGSMEPPRDLFIDVRVLRDAGEIQTEYGVLSLKKNSQFYVRQADVLRLIQQGYLQKL
ncbi:uncharacterized protein V1510DRAFT_415469 [Dipodascopsis tothii]|uniref:uncharacterized protein n=1 Tax=Dipodascopsis tothii TaxID=44089 RepID=UPI0034CE8DE1